MRPDIFATMRVGPASPDRSLQERFGDVNVGSSREIGLDPDAKEVSLCHSTADLDPWLLLTGQNPTH